MTTDDIATVAREYFPNRTVEDAHAHGSGHINDTYATTMRDGEESKRYIFQRINRTIFRDVEGLMDNIARVTAHLRKKADASPQDAHTRPLTLVPTRTGRFYHEAATGEAWRVYEFIENAQSFDVCTGPEQAREAAGAFARFQRDLCDLPGGPLKETIPYFHHTPRRYAALENALLDNAAGRAAGVKAEIAFCSARKAMTARVLDLMEAGRIPQRTTHNDTKLNNVMIDARSGRAVCVIDLDTVMPGSVLFDFGDMIRTSTPTAPEDEPDLNKVRIDLAIFEGLANGYGAVARNFLAEYERENLVFSGKLITFTIGIRFLADYLAGDVYFKVHRPGHNLDRARTQFKMVEEIERHEDEMEAIVRSALA